MVLFRLGFVSFWVVLRCFLSRYILFFMIARAGRGTAEFVVNERLETKVVAQLEAAIQPALNDVSVAWDVPIDATAPTTVCFKTISF